MALKTEKKDNLEYLEKLCEDSGIEIVLPDLEKNKEDEEEQEQE